MTPERWRQVEQLFDAARQRPAGERAVLLRAADPELRAEVEPLLAAHEASGPLDGSPFPCMVEALKVGERLGNFEIIGLLGRGGMGEVYRARDTRLGREVAIKTLPPAVAADRDRVARFEREARAASALNHPNIVSVHDVGRESGVSFIVSELVQGETLRGPLPLRKLIEVGTQICDGLAAAHAAGVVHRDLKPGNVMLTRDGRVKILDFGLARTDRKVGAESTTMDVSHPGLVLGTPGYMSPEQVRGEATDARSDIFSLGVLLYEMASGKKAFGGDTSVEVMNAILKEDPPQLPPASPSELDRIIRHCLEKEPERRFQSAADAGFALGALERPAPVPAARKRLPWPAWAAGAALLGGAAAGAYWWGHRGSAPALDNTTLRQITWDRGLTADPALSPDGRLLAYASDRGGSDNLDIWVQQIDGSGDPVRLTNDPADDFDPDFDPDGTRIAFRSGRNGGGIYVVPTLGGEATLLVPTGWRPRFSPDGRHLMYSTGPMPGRAAPVSVGKLMVMSLSDGSSVDVAAGCGNSGSAAWSQDGKQILFAASCGTREAFMLADPSGRQRRETRWSDYFKKNPATLAGPEIAWLDKPPRLLLFGMYGTAESLVSIPMTADGMSGIGPPQRLVFGAGAVTQASAGRNGRIAVATATRESNIWGIPIDDSGRAPGAVRQLTTGFNEYIYPTLSADSRVLAFGSFRHAANFQFEIISKDLATGKTRMLPSPGEALPIVSKDGRYIAYCSGRSLYTLPSDGGVPKGVASPCEDLWDWSHDGRTFLANPSPQDGTMFAIERDTGKATLVLAASGRETWQGHFSPDDRWMVFNAVEHGNSRLFIAPFRREVVPPVDWHSITGDDAWADKPRFSADGRTLYFISNRDGYLCLWGQRLTLDMRADGEPFNVHHSHQSRRSIGNATTFAEISAGKGMIVFPQSEVTGNIWLLEPAKK